MTKTEFNAYVPTKVLFGAGQLNNLHKELTFGEKALLVISNGKSARESGALRRTEEQLTKANMTWILFDEIESNPLSTTVMRGAKTARETKCDCIVALGGGSVMDAAKAISVMVTNTGNIWDYMQGGTGGKRPIVNKPLPLVAITTTAGTGSEVDAAGVISNANTNEKMGIRAGFPTRRHFYF